MDNVRNMWTRLIFAFITYFIMAAFVLLPKPGGNMGTPLPPNEPGVACPLCFGPGQPFGDQVTPHVIKVQLTSQLPGEFYTEEAEQLLATTHYLECIGTECRYDIDAGGFHWYVHWLVGGTWVGVHQIATGYDVFSNRFAPECAVDIENKNINPAHGVMYGGFMNITWDQEGL